MAETTTELEILKIFLNISNYQNWPEEPEIGQLLSIALLTQKKNNAQLNKTQQASFTPLFQKREGRKKKKKYIYIYSGKIREGKERETERRNKNAVIDHKGACRTQGPWGWWGARKKQSNHTRNEGGSAEEHLDLDTQKSQRASLYFSQAVVLNFFASRISWVTRGDRSLSCCLSGSTHFYSRGDHQGAAAVTFCACCLCFSPMHRCQTDLPKTPPCPQRPQFRNSAWLSCL